MNCPGIARWVDTCVNTLNKSRELQNPLIMHQLFEKESSTYTYILADAVTKDAIIIDPVLETVER